MAFAIPALLTGASFLGGLFGGKSKNSGTINQTTTNTPTYDPLAGGFRDYLINQFQNNLQDNPQFDSSYIAGGVKNIQRSTGVANDALQSLLESRGLARTTAGASLGGEQAYRAGSQISDFLTQAPLTLDQRRQQLLTNAGGFFSTLPYSTSQTTTGKTTGNYTGGGVGQGISHGAQDLAAFLGQMSAMKNLQKILDGSGGPAGGGDYGDFNGIPGGTD
jgi:hypothetical protein